MSHYAAVLFQAVRSGEKFRKFEASWAEQRAYIPAAVSALAGMLYYDEAKREFSGDSSSKG